MDELMIQLAELLEISVEGVKEMYPVIRTQYMWYQSLNYLQLLMVIVAIFAVTVLTSAGLVYHFNRPDVSGYEDNGGPTYLISEKDYLTAKRNTDMSKWLLKYSAFTSIASVVIITATAVGKVLLTPDLQLIMKLLN